MAFSTTLLIPGQPISLPKSSTNGITPPARPGRGAYLDPQGVLRASVVGRVAWDETQGGGGGGIVSVVAAGVVGAGGGALPGGGAVPEIGSVVTGTVIRLTPQQATVQILLVDGLAVASLPPSTGGSGAAASGNDGYTGVIRAQDVRLAAAAAAAAAPDTTAAGNSGFKMSECFRLGDLVRAEVLSLGDARSYYLTTAARNELGVVSARSERTGEELVPVSWREMKDPTTGEVERRKVAKPE